jgi:outer membrane immunogenic protein
LNWQVAPQWVLGVEGDVGFASQTTAFPGFIFGPHRFNDAANSLAIKTAWDASARGRLGFLVTPTTLIYATGGAAWQHFDVTSSCTSAVSCVVGNGFTPAVITSSTTKVGWTIGGGVETALWSHWFARAEYRYADFGSSAFTVTRSSTIPAENPTVENFNVALRTHTATFGLAYKFDWGNSVVAKY